MNWSDCITYDWVHHGVDNRWWWHKDFNCDGAFSLSDIWQGFKWVTHAPGDFLVRGLFSAEPEVGAFFEVAPPYHGSYFATGLGIILILILLGGFSGSR